MPSRKLQLEDDRHRLSAGCLASPRKGRARRLAPEQNFQGFGVSGPFRALQGFVYLRHLENSYWGLF